jgi:choline dehydrogenase-like flavoprotein
MGTTPLTPQERRLRWVLRIAAIALFAETFIYLLPALIGSDKGEWGELPFVANSVVKAGLLGGLCVIAAADLRRFDRLVSLMVAGFGIWVIAGVAFLLFGDTSKTVAPAGIELSMTTIIWLGIAWQGGMAVGLAVLHRSAFRARYSLEYISPGQFRTLSALAEALMWTAPQGVTGLTEPPPELQPDEVADNADRYLRSFRARRKWLMKLALSGLEYYPLRYLRQPLSLMAADERRRFLTRRFGDDVARRRITSWLRWLVQGMIRLGQQVVYLGYYGDERTWASVGYKPFSARNPEAARTERKRPGGLEVASAMDEPRGYDKAEVVIVGSGAAGALIGYRLAEAGRRVLILEHGSHIDPADFSENEVQMLGTLYRDGAVQLSRDFRFQVLQGMCVGGTTVINNAVSIPPPEDVLAEWERRTDGGLDPGRVTEAVESVKTLMHIQPQPKRVWEPGAEKFTAGVHELGLDRGPKRYHAVEANIEGCLGCGYCNIGCAYGRKLSMLDTLLPQAQELPGDRLRILADCEVEGIERSNGVVDAVQCKAGKRRFRVRGKRFVVAAGTVASSYLLGRSGVGGSGVGEGLSFNAGSPITAEFAQPEGAPPLNSYAGLQITHVFEPGGGPEVVMETWFNPVLSQALLMPGWFEDHRRNMRNYANMAATGVLVGTAPEGKVRKALLGGADIVYKPSQADLRRLLEGLKLAGRINFAAGASRVMPATFQFHSFREPDELDQLDEIVRDNEDIQVGTGHPQGGNSLAARIEEGPVDPRSFRVHGFSNLNLCDASVFPTSVRVNPQLTVMSLAECAAEAINRELG